MRVVLADDHVLLRQSLRMFVERDPSIAVVGEAGTGSEALRIARATTPDVVVLDLSMPEMDGAEAAYWLQFLRPRPAVAILTGVDLALYRKRLEAANVRFVAEKTVAGSEFAERLLAIADLAVAPDAPPQAADALELCPLTPRQMEVLKAVARGMVDKEVARHLGITERTVHMHVTDLKARLGATTRANMVWLAWRHLA